jgi:hypothetical protein
MHRPNACDLMVLIITVIYFLDIIHRPVFSLLSCFEKIE